MEDSANTFPNSLLCLLSSTWSLIKIPFVLASALFGPESALFGPDSVLFGLDSALFAGKRRRMIKETGFFFFIRCGLDDGVIGYGRNCVSC